ncbi:Bug family tripartite tricarboxylate transporter substrate binding protein [Muricoccus vinaceus]|uniref:Bug family tripartite tricarboxylate transporter substrate binding protein n=1 Tax=Muricoccus vinaceus TaxID=424704 RepID=A0ABV6IPZ2_9PROT
MNRRRLLASPILLAAPALAQGTRPAGWPSRAIRLVVPFAPGGPSDIAARALAPTLSAALGQPVVVDNRAGSGGVVGTDAVAKAQPDGHTIGLCSAGALAISPSLQPSMPYDVLRDLVPVTMGVRVAEILAVAPSLPVRDLAALIALAKQQPGKLNYSTSGNGSMPHLAMEALRAAAGIDVVHVPYRSGGQIVTAMLTGETQMGWADLPILMPQLAAGALRPIVIGSEHRSPHFPDVPTTAEAGLPQVRADNWHGFVAPARTPPALVTALREAIAGALQAPAVSKVLQDQGAEPGGDTPEAFGAFLRSEIARWGEVVRSANVKPD